MVASRIIKSNSSVNVSGDRAVVVGGTQGIGGGVARRLAKAGAEVWIVGRSEERGNAALLELNSVSPEAVDSGIEHYFFKTDLSRKPEIERVAEEIKHKAGERGIDYLVLTQGGPSNGDTTLNPDGFDDHFAVQVLSRFGLAYLLSPITHKSVMAVAVAATGGKTFDVDDILMKKAQAKNDYGILNASARDGTVLDSVFLDFPLRYPSIQFTHLFPGLVNTNVFHNSQMAWLISFIFGLLAKLFGASPDSYAEAPFYLLANQEGRKLVEKDGQFWNEKPSPISPSPCAKNEATRKRIWAELEAIFKK